MASKGYYIRVSSSAAGIPQYWSQQVISATQKNIYYNYGNAGIGIPVPKASLHLVNNCCIGSAFANSDVPTDSLIVSSNVGIGTALPQATLHVQGNALVTGNLTVSGSNIVNNQIVNNIEYNSSNVIINNLSGLGPALKVSQSGAGLNYPIADFYDNDVSTTIPALRIADGGNVGIGTTLPQATLDVNGVMKNKNPYALIHGNGNNVVIANGAKIPLNLVYINNYPSSYNTTTYTYTAPVSGTYYIQLILYINTAIAPTRILLNATNGIIVQIISISVSTGEVSYNGSVVLQLNAGDSFNFTIYLNSITAYFSGNSYFHTMATVSCIG